MSTVFFTSDTHFYHHNILKFEPETRPFGTVEEMNEEIVKRWNSIVGPRDHVWHLGDVLFGTADNIKIISRLNGTKHLVMGNHDELDAGLYRKYFKSVQAIKKKYGVVMSHVPIHLLGS